jgi:hypothetical protein
MSNSFVIIRLAPMRPLMGIADFHNPTIVERFDIEFGIVRYSPLSEVPTGDIQLAQEMLSEVAVHRHLILD